MVGHLRDLEYYESNKIGDRLQITNPRSSGYNKQNIKLLRSNDKEKSSERKQKLH